MKKLILLMVLTMSSTLAFAQGKTRTECIFKSNPKNKVYFDFDYNGNKLTLARTLLVLQVKTGALKEFSYYNYAYMVDAMTYGTFVPYGRRAEVVNFQDELERTGQFNLGIVNYSATSPSVLFNSKANTVKYVNPDSRANWIKRAIRFEGTLKTVLKTENISDLENGTSLSVNEVSCYQTIL